MKGFKIGLVLVLVLVMAYWLGPKPPAPVYRKSLPVVPAGAAALENYVQAIEGRHALKANNQARIVWANDSAKAKTKYAIVYLHGFSASQEEGNPVHRQTAQRFGANLYLARLASHGIDTTPTLMDFTAERLWESAQEALAIGLQLGDSVILMGTSTGGTVALQLAAAFPQVSGLVLYSPNIAINDPNAWLLNNPWGLQIARLVKGGKDNVVNKKDSIYKQYWNSQYRLESIVELQELLETTMVKATFEKVKQPTLVLYYYKNEKEQDPVVKVSAMKEMFAQLGTPEKQKQMVPLANVGNHVMASPIQSKDIASVGKETARFLQEVMGLKAN
jgi:esterase/lipase